jgi:hypothetical protein
MEVLRRKQDPDCLFWVACRVGEMMIELKRPKPGIARQLLVEACPGLDRDEVHRVIGNAFHHVEKAELE